MVNVDKAIGCMYQLAGENRGSKNYIETLQALRVLEEASEALYKSQQVLQLELRGDFDKDLHGVMLHTAVTNNTILLGIGH